MRTVLTSAALLGGALLAASSALSGPAAEAPPRPAARAGSFTVDSVHSGVIFRIGHMGVGAYWGRFNRVEGTFELAEKASDSSVSITIPAESVDTNDEGRDKHVKGPDFFNAVEFPEISFVSKRVAKKGERYTVAGDMTLHGVTGPVTIELEKLGEADTRQGYKAGFEGEFTFSRKEFGITAFEGGLGDEIRVIVFIEGARR